MNHLSIVIRFVLASATAIVMALSGITVAQTSSGEVTITGFDLLSSKRVGRTTFEYEYGVNVQNGTSTDVTDVSVTVSSSTTGVTVLDDSATIGAIASGTTATSGDTITVEVDRRVRFSPSDLSLEFDYEAASTTVTVSDPAGRVSFETPTSWIVGELTEQSLSLNFSLARAQADMPPNIIAQTYDVPTEISLLPFREAHREVLRLSGVSPSEILSESFVNGGLAVDAHALAGYRFVMMDTSQSNAVVFLSGEPFLAKPDFQYLVTTIDFLD